MGHCVPLCPGPPWAEGPVGLPQHGRPALRPARLSGWAGARRYPLIYSYCPRPGGRSTVSTRADVLCKIEQLNGLNKSDDKTLIAIFLPPALKRAIWRHLEKYFIKQERKQFAKFCAHLLAKLFSPPPGWGIVDLRGPQGLPGCHWRGGPPAQPTSQDSNPENQRAWGRHLSPQLLAVVLFHVRRYTFTHLFILSDHRVPPLGTQVPSEPGGLVGEPVGSLAP